MAIQLMSWLAGMRCLRNCVHIKRAFVAGSCGARPARYPMIANAVIFYNTALLSRVYEQKLAAADLEAAELVKKVSPVA